MSAQPAFILGTAQTDFARVVSREGHGLLELLRDAATAALDDAGLDAAFIDAAHVGNFVGQSLSGQGQLGGLLVQAVPGLGGAARSLPVARHEAACASGSVALIQALQAIRAGDADVVLVVGAEEERNVSGDACARALGSAAWAGHEPDDRHAPYLWPAMFHELMECVAERSGLDERHTRAIAQKNRDNATQNPLAQTRTWTKRPGSFSADDVDNPVVHGRVRRSDCGQVTDGAAALVIASPRFAAAHAARRGVDVASLPQVLSASLSTTTLSLSDKLERAAPGGLMFPHVQRTFQRALAAAGVGSVMDLMALEVHDCFSITEYLLYEHLGLCAPGQGFVVVEEGTAARSGALPVNPGGGLIGIGHPVGATGVRMVRDAAQQVSGQAGACQVAHKNQPPRVATLNIGGSFTTVASVVVGVG